VRCADGMGCFCWKGVECVGEGRRDVESFNDGNGIDARVRKVP